MTKIETTKYSAFDIANYVVQQMLDNQKHISNLKLNKILYFLQASFLVENNQTLFEEQFSKWVFGATIVPLYETFREFGASPISKTMPKITWPENNPLDIQIKPFQKNDIDYETRNIIDSRLEKLNSFTDAELVEMITTQSIFQKDFVKIQTYSAPLYSNQEIKNFFNKNITTQIWK